MGKLYGIGVGPGDPELLTLKAHRILNAADVIFCPEKEAGAGSFAFDIIQGLLEDTKAEIVNLVYPMHYHGSQLREMWKQNAGCIAQYLMGTVPAPLLRWEIRRFTVHLCIPFPT